MEDIKQIEEYKLKIEALKVEQENVAEKKKRLQDRWGELNREINTLENKISQIENDKFRKECAKGLHKIVNYSDIPSGLWWEKTKMFEEISGGCKGDWEVGCRGCEHACERKAYEKFMQKYNIEEIVY